MTQLRPELPKLDLTTFFFSISSAAFMSLDAEKADLELARQNIDLLELMCEKTRGNRTAEEDRLIERMLFETRLKFVEKQREQSAQGPAAAREPGKR